MFSSKTDAWSTPQDLFDSLNQRFGPFDLDVCASRENKKCEQYYSTEDDGLRLPWTTYAPPLVSYDGMPAPVDLPPKVSRAWMNPPYGRHGGGIAKWISKAKQESDSGCAICCLLPTRTDTAWFHDIVLPTVTAKRASLEFIRGRVKFIGPDNSDNSAPFPSMIVVFFPPQGAQ